MGSKTIRRSKCQGSHKTMKIVSRKQWSTLSDVIERLSRMTSKPLGLAIKDLLVTSEKVASIA